MKRTVLLLAFSGMFFFAKAQTLNIQAGTTISNLDWELNHYQPEYRRNIIGYSFFVGMDYLDKKYINLSSNIGFIRKGGMWDVELFEIEKNFITYYPEKATLDYFSTNTLIELKYPVTGRFIPFISLGPRVDFLVSRNARFEDFNEQGFLHEVAFGILAGGGIKFVNGKSIIGFRFDYYADINDIATYQVFNQAEPAEIKARTFSLNVSYGYRF